MVRAPCCEKMGLKRGPWTAEEDEVLISHIKKHGHSNWRALPKQAGLMRCGKSCRLRWTNYLRPDIKRGNFSREEEDAIVKLHSTLGNRWSAIAASLRGRTDNEIKNVWHSHLKKRLKQSNLNPGSKEISSAKPTNCDSNLTNQIKSEKIDFLDRSSSESASRQPSSSATDASVISWETYSSFEVQTAGITKPFPSIDRSFSIDSSWVQNSSQTFQGPNDEYGKCPSLDDCMDFWYTLFLKAEELPEF